jgi:hypothetical protein
MVLSLKPVQLVDNLWWIELLCPSPDRVLQLIFARRLWNKQEVGCGFLLGQQQIPCHAEYARAQAGVAWTLLEDGAQAGKPAFGERVTESGESQMVLITGEKQLARFGQGLL